MKPKNGLWFRKESQNIKKAVRQYMQAMGEWGDHPLSIKEQARILADASLLVAHGMAELFGPPELPPAEEDSDIPF